jgi:hypothetical protein
LRPLAIGGVEARGVDLQKFRSGCFDVIAFYANDIAPATLDGFAYCASVKFSGSFDKFRHGGQQ